jgi:hypothetical protein
MKNDRSMRRYSGVSHEDSREREKGRGNEM